MISYCINYNVGYFDNIRNYLLFFIFILIFLENNFEEDKCEYYIKLLEKCCTTLTNPTVSCSEFKTSVENSKS